MRENDCNKLWRKIFFSLLGTLILYSFMTTYDLYTTSMKVVYKHNMAALDYIANNSDLTISERQKILSHFIENYTPNYMGEGFWETFIQAVLSIKEQHNN